MTTNRQDLSEMRRPDTLFKVLGIATIALTALPFVIAAVERWTGGLPDEAAWLEQGWNHGPWRWTAEGLTVLYPLATLALITVILAIWRTLSIGKLYPIVYGATLLAIQILGVVLQVTTLFWLID